MLSKIAQKHKKMLLKSHLFVFFTLPKKKINFTLSSNLEAEVDEEKEEGKKYNTKKENNL